MTAFSHLVLQQALYDTLNGDATLMALIDAVYDRVPDDSAYPYVTIGEIELQDWSSKTFTGTACNIALHAWSREGGRKQAAQIMQRLHSVLHDQPLSVTGHSVILLRFAASSITLEKDGWSYHGEMRFESLLQAD